MNPALWFVVPVAGRLELAAICLRQLRRTCDALISEGVDASVVVVVDEREEQHLRERGGICGFGVHHPRKQFTSAKFNDGIQLATDPRFNPRPADYVVPCGSDDWVDHRLFREPLPGPDTIVGFQRMSFVNEEATEISTTFINYRGGAGIRIIPRELLAPLGYRPADEDRRRGCDTSILSNLSRHHGDRLQVQHWHLHDRQIIDWKTRGQQLNPYCEVTGLFQRDVHADPFMALSDYYPADALDEMRAYYGVPALVAA